MPLVWKPARYQANIFHENVSWRKPLRTGLSLLWLASCSVLALWFLAGGPEARRAADGIHRGITFVVDYLITAVQRFFGV